MHGLQQYLAFAETAKHGSFAAAARELGSVPSTLAKAVARLERTLGVKLFHRTTRQVRLTPDGERLFERCQRVLAEVEALHEDASGTRAEPAGAVRIDLPIVYGKRFVLPVLAALVRKHPGLQFDVRLSDAYVDLVRDGIDLSIRVGALDDSSLVARLLDRQGMVLCASPRYLAAAGTPRRIDDLDQHAAIVFRMPTSGRNRAWSLRQRGKPVQIHPPARMRLGDGEGLVEALKLGLGIGQVPDYFIADELARGQLVEVLPTCRPEPLPMNVVVPGSRMLPARVRVVIDAILAMGRARGSG